LQYLIISGDPKPEGMYDSVMQEIIRGASDSGAVVQTIDLEGIESCKICKGGEGDCRNAHRCAFGTDGFDAVQQAVRQTDAWCLLIPIVSGQPGEAVLSFLERMQRCESGQFGELRNKPVLVVLFPQSPDNSLLTCLEHVDRFCRHTGITLFDYFSVNTWNLDYIKVSAYSASKVMGFGRKTGTSGTRKRQRSNEPNLEVGRQ